MSKGPDTRQTGRVVIVTGAASGIGRATVERLVAHGASVVAVDRSPDTLAWIEQSESAERIHSLVGDVTAHEVNAGAVAAAVDRFGRLDAAVFNAGVSMGGDLLDLPMEEFDRSIEVNVRAVALGIRAVVPTLRANGGGRIVVTASTSGIAGDPNMWAYNAAKGAVINLVRSAAVDLGPDGVTVNAVCPGPTETAMTERLRTLDPEMPHLLDELPISVSVWAQRNVGPWHEDVAYLRLEFPTTHAFVHVSWLNPNKVRRTTVVGRAPDGGVRRHVGQRADPHLRHRRRSSAEIDSPHMAHEMPVSYRTGDIISPFVPFREPLMRPGPGVRRLHPHAAHRPTTPGERGLDIVRVLAATRRRAGVRSAGAACESRGCHVVTASCRCRGGLVTDASAPGDPVPRPRGAARRAARAARPGVEIGPRPRPVRRRAGGHGVRDRVRATTARSGTASAVGNGTDALELVARRAWASAKATR